jgi:hypothetical protein
MGRGIGCSCDWVSGGCVMRGLCDDYMVIVRGRIVR